MSMAIPSAIDPATSGDLQTLDEIWRDTIDGREPAELDSDLFLSWVDFIYDADFYLVGEYGHSIVLEKAMKRRIALLQGKLETIEEKVRGREEKIEALKQIEDRTLRRIEHTQARGKRLRGEAVNAENELSRQEKRTETARVRYADIQKRQNKIWDERKIVNFPNATPDERTKAVTAYFTGDPESVVRGIITEAMRNLGFLRSQRW